ncbi:MAG: hypothetical protein JW864_14570 [Spirochaetes bacterium]|nr:hypothetical protein [Spirochaetota bacterium]
MAILQFIEIVLGRVNNYKKNRIIKKEKIHKTEHSRPIEIQPELFNKQSGYSSYMSSDSGEKIEVSENYEEFINAVEEVNSELAENEAKYRLSVSRDEGDIYFSILRFKETGEAYEINRKNITHDNYYEWIRHIEKGGGFFIDESE